MEIGDDRIVDWDYPATKHLCFPEGWMWFITLISWHFSPLHNLMDMLAYFIELVLKKIPVDEMPSTRELSKMFDCPFELITSVGFAIRDDREFSVDCTKSKDIFTNFENKYSVISSIMNTYEILPEYYGRRTYFSMKPLAYFSPVVAGRWWFAIGNSSGFTNPLISPGINAGICGALYAAKLTHETLAAKDDETALQNARNYQSFIRDFVMLRLNLLNRLWYNSFRDTRLFEAVIVVFWVIGVGDLGHYQHDYSDADFKWLVGAGANGFAEFCYEVMPSISGPCDGVPVSDDIVNDVRLVCKKWLNKFHKDGWSKHMRHYDDSLNRVLGKTTRNCIPFKLCSCNHWQTNLMVKCAVCKEIIV